MPPASAPSCLSDGGSSHGNSGSWPGAGHSKVKAGSEWTPIGRRRQPHHHVPVTALRWRRGRVESVWHHPVTRRLQQWAAATTP